MTPEERTQLKDLLKKAIVECDYEKTNAGYMDKYMTEYQMKANIVFLGLSIAAIEELERIHL